MTAYRPHIDTGKLPHHVAVIMDGNGRWARQRGQKRTYGHLHGVDAVRRTVEAAGETGIPFLTLYAFSTENWNRPQEEVNTLMNLLAETIEREQDNLIEKNIRLHVAGDMEKLPAYVKEKFAAILEKTSPGHRMTLTLALNYGGRNEIVSAVNRILAEGRHQQVSEEVFEQYLQTARLPDVDLLIRTGGEQRISNFLLWKAAYAELYFTNVLWPDFTKDDFLTAIADYQKRERRFGKTSEQIQNQR